MTQKQRVADYIVRRLEDEGVTHAFMLAGGGMMHLQDAVSRSTKIRYVCCHHEQSCAFAAEAHARASGGLGVCLATSGPGGTNTVTGIAQAWVDSSPVVFLVGQAKLSETIRGTGVPVRQFGTFEVDLVSMVQSITKYAAFVDDPSSIRHHLDQAIGLARSGRPGPTLLELPVNIQGAMINSASMQPFPGSLPTAHEELPDGEIDEVLDRLTSAKRPLILAGHGLNASNLGARFRDSARAWNIPVATTPLANDLLPYDDDLFVGHPSVKGDRAGNIAVQSADVLLTLGCSLHSMTTGYELKLFAPRAYKIQVELDPAVLTREQVGVSKKLRVEAGAFIKSLDARATQRGLPISRESEWHRHCRRLKSELSVEREPHVRRDGEINYYDVVFALNTLIHGSAVLIADAGSAYYILGQAYRAKPEQRVIISGGLGQMGYTTSALIGAAFADPKRRVFGLTGDGSLQTNLHDLSVIAAHQLNAVLIVVNNGGYVSIRNTQNAYFDGYFSGVDRQSGLPIPDHRLICEAVGLRYMAVSKPDRLQEELRAAFDSPGPLLIEIFASYEQQILPAVQSVRMPDGSLVSRPLHDMYPFLPPEKLDEYLRS